MRCDLDITPNSHDFLTLVLYGTGEVLTNDVINNNQHCFYCIIFVITSSMLGMAAKIDSTFSAQSYHSICFHIIIFTSVNSPDH